MSRVGNQPINLPENVTTTIEGQVIRIKGPLGELAEKMPAQISFEKNDNTLVFKRRGNIPAIRALHGLARALVANMITGVTKGFEKRLELVGTGYRATQTGSNLTLTVGFSHPVEIVPTPGITLKTEGNNAIIVSGISRHDVGQVAANIRKVRPPEPYNGKGIRYKGEVVRRKAGKAAKVGA